MPILNFKEIPEANKSSGKQDTFELFARDFLENLGYEIIQGPDRGADGGRDIIVEEVRKGIGGITKCKWLVSCKHNAHSGNSVGVKDEIDIAGRVNSNKCDGFIGFYSTLPSSGLTRSLEGLKDRIAYHIFDAEKIEKKLFDSKDGFLLAKRYFSKSVKKWEDENPQPEKYFWKYPKIQCEYCGKNLLDSDNLGIVAIWETYSKFRKNPDINEILDIYFSCKGDCDRRLKDIYNIKYQNAIDGWEDIPDICIPTIYLKWMNNLFHNLYNKVEYSEIAFKKITQLMLAIFPYISRKLTKNEKERIKGLEGIPSFLGGLGAD